MALFKIIWQPSKAELHDYLLLNTFCVYLYLSSQAVRDATEGHNILERALYK